MAAGLVLFINQAWSGSVEFLQSVLMKVHTNLEEMENPTVAAIDCVMVFMMFHVVVI